MQYCLNIIHMIYIWKNFVVYVKKYNDDKFLMLIFQ